MPHTQSNRALTAVLVLCTIVFLLALPAAAQLSESEDLSPACKQEEGVATEVPSPDQQVEDAEPSLPEEAVEPEDGGLTDEQVEDAELSGSDEAESEERVTIDAQKTYDQLFAPVLTTTPQTRLDREAVEQRSPAIAWKVVIAFGLGFLTAVLGITLMRIATEPQPQPKPEQKPKKEGNKSVPQQKQITDGSKAPAQENSFAAKVQGLFPVEKPQIVSRQTQVSPPKQAHRLEDLVRETMDTLDLQKPEGFWDNLDNRIEKKTERALRLAELRGAWVTNLEQLRKVAEAYGALDQVRYQEEAERIKAQRLLLEEQCRIENTAKAAERQEAVEDAKAEAEIAKYKKEAKDALREPPPPPPPPLPPPSQEEIRANKRKHLREQIEQNKRDEQSEIENVTQRKPDSEWTGEVRDEVMKIKNMFASARERKREEMERYL